MSVGAGSKVTITFLNGGGGGFGRKFGVHPEDWVVSGG